MDLFDLVKTQLSDDLLARLAGSLGESAQGTKQALLAGAVPAILGGLVQRYHGEAGAARLLDLLRSGGHDGTILNNLEGALAGGAETDSLLDAGKGLLGPLLGGREDAVAELLASTSGIQRGSAGSLLGLAAPLVLNVLGRQVHASGLGTAGIVATLASLPRTLDAAAAPGLATAMGLTDFAVAAPVVEARRAAIWPWLVVPAVALTMFFGLQRCQKTSGAPPAASSAAPAR